LTSPNPSIGRWLRTNSIFMTNRISFGISANFPGTLPAIICGFYASYMLRNQTARNISAFCQLVKFLQSVYSLHAYNHKRIALRRVQEE
jgi:hypothetical protein